jgi:hypothetical protein
MWALFQLFAVLRTHPVSVISIFDGKSMLTNVASIFLHVYDRHNFSQMIFLSQGIWDLHPNKCQYFAIDIIAEFCVTSSIICIKCQCELIKCLVTSP